MTSNKDSNGPVQNVNSEAIRCYQMRPGGGGTTSTHSIRAGSQITWTAAPNIFHPGPLSGWMAKVPAGQTAQSWDGSGAVWFKTYQEMPTIGSGGMQWSSLNKGSVSFTIPSCIANGDYLFRVEHNALHGASSNGGAQFYISCAQLTVTGGSGSKTPTNLVSFPGAYKATDPGISEYLRGALSYFRTCRRAELA